MKDKIIEIVHSYTDGFPEFEETQASEMAEKILLVVAQEIAAAMNNARGFGGA